MEETPTDSAPSAPPRPSPREERLSSRLFFAVSPRLDTIEQPAPPDSLRPFAEIRVPREQGGGDLSAIWFPVEGGARGAILLLHPWLSWGKSYFYRRGRLEALRAAGYHALALDLSGFGRSARGATFLDRDVAAGLAELRRRAPGLPLHVWGVSSGGYWAHPVLARLGSAPAERVASAMFEDVAAHLFEWSWRMAPLGRPVYLLFRTLFGASYHFLDVRRHARDFRLGAATYVSGAEDRGVRPVDTEALAAAARAESWIVPGAGHLAAIKVANERILELALATFRRGEEASLRP